MNNHGRNIINLQNYYYEREFVLCLENQEPHVKMIMTSL